MTGSASMKVLGMTLQPDLKFTCHINDMIPKLSSATFMVRRIRQIAGVEAAKSAYFAHFHSIIQYCLLIWGGASESEKIFKKQKCVIRLLCNAGSRESCRKLSIQEGILTLPCMYILACADFIHKNRKEIPKNNAYHQINTRNGDRHMIPFHRINCAQLSTNYAAIKIYNKFPLHFKQLNKTKFKHAVKKYLLQRPFLQCGGIPGRFICLNVRFCPDAGECVNIQFYIFICFLYSFIYLFMLLYNLT